MRLQEKLSAYTKEGKALLATNFYNFEHFQDITGSKAEKAAVILSLQKAHSLSRPGNRLRI